MALPQGAGTGTAWLEEEEEEDSCLLREGSIGRPSWRAKKWAIDGMCFFFFLEEAGESPRLEVVCFRSYVGKAQGEERPWHSRRGRRW